MTLQQIYTTVRRHLLAQNKQSGVYNGGSNLCYYRYTEPDTGAVLKCAVGCLINDDEYVPRMDDSYELPSTAIRGVAEHYPDLACLKVDAPETLKERIDTLAELQRLHDNNEPEYWPRLLDDFATRRRLVTE